MIDEKRSQQPALKSAIALSLLMGLSQGGESAYSKPFSPKLARSRAIADLYIKICID
ncbi:MAG: hypothetical protein V7L13_28285 [Nostoc sp.]|uniref:hypothetical protein n=1 Tax=Nostoc sp. TaxID=1180 RepID=UPI002FFD16BD